MKFKYKLLIACLVITFISLLQTLFKNNIKEGYESLTDSQLTFAQYSKKHGLKNSCYSAPFEEIGMHVEVMKSIDDMKSDINDATLSDAEVINKYVEEHNYDEIWQSGTINVINVNENINENNTYDILYSDESIEQNVIEERIKSHHQNVCKICRNNVDDNQCTDDCRKPNVYLNKENEIIIESEGNCLPVKKGVDAQGNDIEYRICPFVCKNGEKSTNDLACVDDNCCFGCGYSVFEVDENGVFKNKLDNIPTESSVYSVSENGGRNNVKDINEGGLNGETYYSETNGNSDNSAGAGADAGAGAGAGSDAGAGAGAGSDAGAGAGETSNSENNVVNAFNDNHACWLGPTGHSDFMYCGPAPITA